MKERGRKMFKRTNKAWKALALVLALCMLSTIVYAEDPATATVSITTTAANAYNEDTLTATIAGQITAGKDVTIIALRDADAVTKEDFQDTEIWTAQKLQDQVVYIDQEECEDGNYSFSFIPRTGVRGGTITVFVGGEDVSEIKTLSFEAQNPAPALKPQAWYEGESTLKIDLVKQNDANTAYGEGAQGWYEAINSVKVNNNDVDKATNTAYENGVLSISGFELTGVEVTKIDITTDANEYSVINWTGSAKQAKKAAGTLATDKGEYVAGETIVFTATGDDDDWNAAATSAVKAKVSDSALTADAITEDASTTATVSETALEETYYAVAKVLYYEPSNVVSYKVVAPTKKAADEVAVSVNYGTTPDSDPTTAAAMEEAGVTETTLTGDNIKLFGAASITIPAAADGFTYAWEITQPDGQGLTLPSIVEGEVALDRPNADGDIDSYSYTLKLTVSKEGFADAEKTFQLSTNKVGESLKVDAEDVTVVKTDAYGMSDKTLVIIDMPADELDPTVKSMKIGDAKLYYSEAKAKYYGLVAGEDAATIANSVEFVDEAAEKLYFGVAATNGPNPDMRDFGYAGRMTKNAETPSDKIYIAMDVNDAEPNGMYDMRDFGAHGRKTKGVEFPVLAE